MSNEQNNASPIAYLTEDGERCITAKTYNTARNDGGAIWSTMRPFCVPAYATPPAAAPAPAVPQGYEIHEIPADYSGLVWLEGQVRAVARRAQAATGPQGWTDADSDAARLALELECLLMDTKDLSVVSKWWGSANDALELHRQRLAATPAPAPAVPQINYHPGTWYEVKTREELEAFFLSRLPAIREAAREHGYAIGLHGSLRRDMDLIAVPWRDGASDKDKLAHAIAMAAVGITRDGGYKWEAKPAGRVATSLACAWTTWYGEAGAGHIDLSVMPAAPSQEPSFCDYCGGNDEDPQDHCMDCERPSQPVTLTDEWAECKRISELPEVDGALRLFAEGETTEDQAVAIVQAIIAALREKEGK